MSSPVEFYETMGMIVDQIDNLGMSFYKPFDVSGYDAYCQFPVYHRSWITVNYLTRRYEFIRSLVNITEPGMLKLQAVNLFTANFTNATIADARSVVVELARYIL